MRCAPYSFENAIPLHRGGHTFGLAAPVCLRGALCVWPLPWLFNHPLREVLVSQALAKILLW